jgi:carboxyl-terminal processing protease
MTGVRPFSARGLTLSGMVILLGACVGPSSVDDRGGAQLPSQSRRVVTTALDQIQDRYVRPVDLGRLVELGVENVLRADPALQARRNGSEIEITGTEGGVSRVPVAAPGGAQNWASAALGAIEAARARSVTLRAIDADATYKAFFEGVVKGLDPYSRYNTPEAAREERAQREGFGGIGITIDTESGDVRVAAVMDDTPAARAGLQAEDRIVTIEGESTRGLSAREIIRRLRGPVGEPVRVEIRRGDASQLLQVALVRAYIIPQTVSYKRSGDVAHIRLSGFNPKTIEALVDAVRRAEREIGPRMAGIVLDMRNNFGGYLDQSIYVADLFLAEGAIVSTRGRHRTVTQESWARRGDIGEKIPLAVLINGNSASASEIVAAALQDHNRAVVIGTTSFGKGSVQSILTLPNEGEFVLTSARFHAPSGYALADLGVLPHLCTGGNHDTPSAVLEQLRSGRFADRNAAGQWRAVPADDLEARRKLRAGICPSDTTDRDGDLELAKSVLSDRGLYAMAIASTATLATAAPR